MNCKVLLCVALLFHLNIGIEATFFEERPIHISYDSSDPFNPSTWEGECKSGLKQSPIIFDGGVHVLPPPGEPKIAMIGGVHLKPSHIRVVNNGYGVYFEFIYDNLQAPRIFGGPLGAALYKFHGFSYHTEAEHFTNTKSNWAWLELQFLHYNMKYKSVDEAKDKDDGLAIIAVRHKPMGSPKKNFPAPLLSMIGSVVNPYTEMTLSIGGFTYAEALGFSSMPKHFYYEGSLTVPPCFESVKWFIIRENFPMRASDFDLFKNFKIYDGTPIVSNNRPAQNRNGRIITDY